MSMSEVSLKYLTDGGWDETRSVDISPYVEVLQAEGYDVNSFARDFLTKFGGLELMQPAFRVENKLEKLHFNPIIASDRTFRDHVEAYEERVNESLVIIGEALNGHFLLMMSDTGKVYGSYDKYLTILGNDYSEALDSLFLCIRTPEIE